MEKNEYSEKYQKELAKILRSKRLEHKMNLEELSEGICSVSYLSRIENGYVKIQEPYIRQLFEKLDIDYDDLRKSRQNNLFLEVIKKRLLNQKNEYINLLNKIASGNHYLDVEQELILLYDAIVNKRFDEAEIVMESIEKAKYIFSENERIFYMYLISQYYYDICKTELASHHLKNLMQEKIEEEILYFVIFELNMSVNFTLGKYYLYVYDYYKFIKDAPRPYFANLITIHNYKLSVLLSYDNYNYAKNNMNQYFTEIPENNNELKANFYYHLGLMYLEHEEYDLLLKELEPFIEYPYIILLCAIAYMNIGNIKLYPSISLKLDSYNFTKYDELLRQICYYATQKTSFSNVLTLQLVLKNKILKYINQNYNKILDDIFKKELVQINIRCSKYKDACNILLEKKPYNRLFDN